MDIIPENIPQRQCTTCLCYFPATSAYFEPNRTSKDGFRIRCRACVNAINRARYAQGPRPVDIVPDGYKRCTQCKQVLPVNDFSEDKRIRDGVRGACKRCLNKQSKQYRHDLGETLVQRKAQDYQKHKEKTQAKHRLYYREHKEAMRIMCVRYRQNHKEEISERQSRWRQTERGHAIRKAAHQRRRARKRNTAGSFTSAQIQEQLKRQKHRCYYAACGHAKFKKLNGKYIYHIDHTFPLSRVAGTDIPANDMGYIVLACPSCNTSKKDKFPWEWPEGGRLL